MFAEAEKGNEHVSFRLMRGYVCTWPTNVVITLLEEWLWFAYEQYNLAKVVRSGLLLFQLLNNINIPVHLIL